MARQIDNSHLPPMTGSVEPQAETATDGMSAGEVLLMVVLTPVVIFLCGWAAWMLLGG